MERRAGQPATFAAVQFLTQVRPGDRLRFDAALAADGRTVRQCGITGWCGDTLFLQGHGACGGRDDLAAHQGAAMPAVPPPEACPERSEEHTSELQSLMRISYAVFCLKKKKTETKNQNATQHTK